MFSRLRIGNSVKVLNRSYHSFYHINTPILDLNTVENQLLNKAYEEFVPKFGFTNESISKASKSIGLNENSPNALFKFTSNDDLSMELILFHLKKCRQEIDDLRKSELFKENKFTNLNSNDIEMEKLKYLINARLDMNKPILKYLPNILGRMITPNNLINSMKELHNLSDDITYYAGDRSIDFKWYSKRMSISGLYVQSELFMINDSSIDQQDTKNFVDSRLKEIDMAGYVYNSIEEWTFFNAVSTVNMIKSQLARG
jgi:ubiquinone biosynthesis protein COQ9